MINRSTIVVFILLEINRNFSFLWNCTNISTKYSYGRGIYDFVRNNIKL